MRERVCVRVWVECYPRVRKKKRVLQRNERKAEVKKIVFKLSAKPLLRPTFSFWLFGLAVGWWEASTQEWTPLLLRSPRISQAATPL